jgi:Tfp pilus assembly protein PilX
VSAAGSFRGPARQRGTALFFALIVLGLMTLIGLSAFNTSSVNLKVLTNVQARQEATAAADQAAQGVISTTTFINATPPYTTSVDVNVNNDSNADYHADVVATCSTYRAYPAAGQVLDATDPCVGSATLGAFCNQTHWDVRSRVTPASAGAYRGNVGTDVTIHQGVSVLMTIDGTSKAC